MATEEQDRYLAVNEHGEAGPLAACPEVGDSGDQAHLTVGDLIHCHALLLQDAARFRPAGETREERLSRLHAVLTRPIRFLNECSHIAAARPDGRLSPGDLLLAVGRALVAAENAG